MTIETIPVTNARVGLRLDQAATDHFSARGITRSRVQGWIKAGLVAIDGAACLQPSRRLARGETLQVTIPSWTTELIPEAEDVGVVHQDENIVVLNKPANLTVHPAQGQQTGTLVHRLLAQFPVLQSLNGVRPGIVHRLDKDTTGLMVVALNESARLKLAEDFAARRVQKTYLALVHGLPVRSRAVIDAPIGRHPFIKTRMAVLSKGGRPAVSDYQVLWSDPQERFSLLKVCIHTGRTHQIRVHLQHVGHPLLGDPVYSTGKPPALRNGIPWEDRLLKRPMLHAWRLVLLCPRTGQRMHFQLLPPRDFWRVILTCSRQVQRIGLTGLPGCGKSVLLAALSRAGLPTWSADASVKELYSPGQDGWELLHRRFGTRFVADATREVNTTALLAAMRKSPALRKEIETMIQPLAAHRLESFWQQHIFSRTAAAEVPLLLESGWCTRFDVLVGVFCSTGLRREWLKTSRGWDEELQADVESWQWSGPDKLRACDLVVENPGTSEGMALRVKALMRTLQWLRRQKIRKVLHEVMTIITAENRSHVNDPPA